MIDALPTVEALPSATASELPASAFALFPITTAESPVETALVPIAIWLVSMLVVAVTLAPLPNAILFFAAPPTVAPFPIAEESSAPAFTTALLPSAIEFVAAALVTALPIIMASVPVFLSFSQILPPLTYRRFPSVRESGYSVPPVTTPSGLKNNVLMVCVAASPDWQFVLAVTTPATVLAVPVSRIYAHAGSVPSLI